MRYGILYDQTLCYGCKACDYACLIEHNIKLEESKKLSSSSLTFLERTNDGFYLRHLCFHCEFPACVNACPVNAFKKSENGAVIYSPKNCLGCRYCMISCPFNIPKFEWFSKKPEIKKCDMCFETRLKRNMEPACSSVCPTGATKFGVKEELIRIAKKRINENREKYHPHIFGEYDYGGTSLFYLFDRRFDLTKFYPNSSLEPIKSVSEKFFTLLKGVAFFSFSTLILIEILAERREKIKNEEKEKSSKP